MGGTTLLSSFGYGRLQQDYWNTEVKLTCPEVRSVMISWNNREFNNNPLNDDLIPEYRTD